MATIKITTLNCERQQDISGLDEPVICLGGLQVWDGKIDKGGSLHPNVSRSFSDNILVELKEANGSPVTGSKKLLGSWTVSDTPTPAGNAPLTATSAGYYYKVYFDVY
jgi:hypothetical protein